MCGSDVEGKTIKKTKHVDFCLPEYGAKMVVNMKGTNHLKSFSGQCFVDHHAGGLTEGICSLHGKFPQIRFSFCLANRYQPLPYGTHWTWPDVSWATPGPAFEQNTMLLLSDSMDRLKIDPSWDPRSIFLSNEFHLIIFFLSS